MRACENICGLSYGGLLRWEKITRKKPPSHINWWTNKLQTLLLERMKLEGSQDWEGAVTAEL